MFLAGRQLVVTDKQTFSALNITKTFQIVKPGGAGEVIFTASQFAQCQALKTFLKQVFKYLDSLHPCTIWTSKFQNPGILCVFLCTCVLQSSPNVHVNNSTQTLFTGKMALRKKIFSFCSWKQKLRTPGKHTLKMQNKSLVSIKF